ncbi:MAG: helix-turn-helix domain-containing protein [Spirochaetaceae bacterium]|nr:helix-turn-helix domain-containing protein [Spirochaetaceae bacterium]
MKTVKGTGQNFDDFLIEQGIYDEVNELAAKKLITYQLQQAMQEQNMTKSSIAKKMKTSRVAIDNILDPTFNTSIDSLERFAHALGKKLTISLI